MDKSEASGTYACPICQKGIPHHHDKKRWIGVDFDGTLAHDHFNRQSPYDLGEPIMPMVYRVQDWIAKGFQVRLMTARMCSKSYTTGQDRDLIKMESCLRAWCLKHIGVELECTASKDGLMEVLWDDRAVRVIRDIGHPEASQSAEIERLQAESEALRQRVAELEAKVPNIPLASEEEKQSGWTLDYKWVSAIEDAVYSEEGWQVGMEGTEAIICKALNIPRTLPTTPQEMKE